MPASRATHTGFSTYHATIGQRRYVFRDLKALLGKASPLRSGDQLAGIAAESGEERVAAHYALADLPLTEFLQQHVVPYEADEVTRLIVDTHNRAAFAPIAHLTVGGFRDWLLADETTPAVVSALAPGVTPEMAAAVSKISRLQDLIVMAAKCTVVTAFRTTVGLPGRLSVRLQPNHPGIAVLCGFLSCPSVRPLISPRFVRPLQDRQEFVASRRNATEPGARVSAKLPLAFPLPRMAAAF